MSAEALKLLALRVSRRCLPVNALSSFDGSMSMPPHSESATIARRAKRVLQRIVGKSVCLASRRVTRGETES